MELRPLSVFALERLVVGGVTRLHEGVTTIGRSPSCTVTETSDYVSRTHAEFQVAGTEDIQIRDLGSTNGIFVNDILYNRTTCRLQVGDRIGIGVSVEDDQISADGKFPIFVLRCIPAVEDNNVAGDPVVPPQAAPIENPVIQTLLPHSGADDSDQLDVSDGEYDEDDDVDDFVQPHGLKNLEIENGMKAQQPSLTATSDEPNVNTVSENIRSIFGDLNPELLKNLYKDPQPSSSKQIPDELNVICISSDEEDDDDDNIRKPGKSPELFDDSFDDVETAPKGKEKIIEEPVTKSPTASAIPDKAIEVAPSKVDDVDEDEEDELYFTQKLFDDLREELPDSDTEVAADYKLDEGGSLIITPIKQEKYSQSLNDTGNIDADEDDDEYDEMLESKWSIKLSQSFSTSFNTSQVYEDDLDSAPAVTTEGIFINVDDYDDTEYDDKFGAEVHIKPEPMDDEPVVEPITSASAKETEKDHTNSLQQWGRASSTKFLFSSSSSSSSEEADHEEEPSTSSSYKTKNNEVDKNVRKLAIIDEIPSKKPRLTSTSKKNKNDSAKTTSQKSSSSRKTHSRRHHSHSSKTKKTRSAENDSLNKDDKASKHLTDSRKTTTENTESKDTLGAYRRSSSVADEKTTGNNNYMSATIARRMSLGCHSIVEENELDDFEENKKPDNEHATPVKMIRGPPEIIAPPQLPTFRGKLRGVSAIQQRLANTIKGVQSQNDLKRKWLEKPDITKRKEQAKCKAIKANRKQKLKELADKKKSDVSNTISKNNTRQKETEKSATAIKNVKVTSVNRGAFLTEDTPSSRINKYKIPKRNAKSINKTSKSSPKSTVSKTVSNATDEPTQKINERKSSSEAATDFSMELLKADEVIIKPLKKPGEQKERAPPRRNKNKLTFDDMTHHSRETTRIQNIQVQLARASSMRSPLSNRNNRKTVRFNDVPEIRYIDRVITAKRKVNQKEASTFNERRNFFRREFPIIDRTEDLLRDVLSWSQLWLQNKYTGGLNMDGLDMVYPMTNEFHSIENYKSILLPLLKMEYLSHLERHMQRFSSKPGYNIWFVSFTGYKDKELLFAKCSTHIKSSELGINDLALVTLSTESSKIKCFGYISDIRKGDSVTSITIEVGNNSITKLNLQSATHINVRRIIEAIRIYFGSFNAVHQLEKTPLFQKIINPLEILNTKSNWKPSIQYKGCDPLNEEQKEILLKTYAKAIDECNPNISLIKGPPGTGKSRLITNLALQLLYGNEVRMLDKKILICAQSNMAVDVIAQQLYAIQKKLSPRAPKYQVIRFGKYDKVHSDVKDITVSRLIERDRKARMLKGIPTDENTTIDENLSNEILRLEARVAELQREHLRDVRQDELIEMRKSLALKKSVQSRSLSHEEERRLSDMYLDNAHIICTTLSSCVKLSSSVKYFDVCIIDEATQCIEPWTIMPLKFGVTSLVMVGDTQQLPATVISERAQQYGLGTSLFTRIQQCLENNNRGEPSPILSLRTQYRMHPDICQWPNMYFYKNQLLNSSSTAEFKLKIQPFSILNLEYKQNRHCPNGQIANSLEAEFVVKLVKTLNVYIPNKYFSYGVITPYAQHRDKLELMLRNSGLQNIMINTIDSYQGIEKDVIIISNARTLGVGFLGKYQRLNVALTRPKKCLILCGNFKNLEEVPSWASLLANARARDLYYDISNIDAADIEENVINKIKIKR